MDEGERLREEISTLIVELSGWMHHADVLIKQLEAKTETKPLSSEAQLYTKMDIGMLNRRIQQTKETIAKLRAQNTA